MSSANDRTLVVVSHYMARPKDDLQALLAQLQVVTSDVLVVINDDAHHGPAEWVKNMPVSCLKRENTGMNIGGWNEGYKQKPDFDHYIFLQDECRIVDNDFLTVYQDRLREPGIGMIGESLNPKWDRSWPELSASPLNYPVHITPGSPAMLRMSFYQACLKNWNIDPGPTGSHLRALIWGFSALTLNAMNGFRVGRNKEECIAAEIAASKFIVQNGSCVEQVCPTPFQLIKHKEWRSDGMSKLSS